MHTYKSIASSLLLVWLLCSNAEAGEATPAETPVRHRVTSSLRPFGMAGPNGTADVFGVFLEGGYEYLSRVLVGAEISPVVLGDARFTSFAVRLKLGYNSDFFSVGAVVGTGYPGFFPVLGPTVRIGRLNGIHGSIRLAWILSPPVRVPTDAAIEVRIPLTSRLGLRIDALSTYPSTYLILFYASAGISLIVHGQGGTNTTTLLLGGGPLYFGGYGGSALFGVEQRL